MHPMHPPHRATHRAGAARRRRPDAGFTLIELITVMVLIGILGAVGAARFFNDQPYAARAYADQAKAVIRYAQKLAIAQNRPVYVRAQPAGFAVCFSSGCASAAELAAAPGGGNSGSRASKTHCLLAGNYVAGWLCEGAPANVVVSNAAGRAELGPAGYFYFDAMGRPYNKADAVGASSSFSRLVLNLQGGGNSYSVTVEAETGYVF